MRRRLRAFVTVLGLGAALVAGVDTPAHAAGGELVIINSVHVGSPTMTTTSDCEGFVDHGSPVIPVTISATFIPPPNDQPNGPYAVSGWSGGFGSSDMHAGTSVAHDVTQHFHILLRPDGLGDYHGAGHYTLWVIVQDVGLAGGFAERDNIGFDLGPPPPATSNAHIKCALTHSSSLGNQLEDMAEAARDAIVDELCSLCGTLHNAWSNINTYSDVLDGVLDGVAEHDPPDANYQQIATPDPPPILPAPDGLSTNQQAALSALEQGLAQAIGRMRAVLTTLDRIWGADNAADSYWHGRQMAALADLAGRAAKSLRALPALFGDLQAALAPDTPQFTVTAHDAFVMWGQLEHGFAADQAAKFTALGVSTAVQRQIAQNMVAVDPTLLPATQDGAAALAGQSNDVAADAMDGLATWATGTADYNPPVVASVSPARIPVSGWTTVTVSGTNLASVTGINFGPSSPGHGQGADLFCRETSCTVTAPPGVGTVDVTAVGPGGPSRISATDRVRYVEPKTPHVTHVFPAAGAKAGGTRVTIFGSGLLGGTVYFGPTEAAQWSCTDTSCSAQAPPSAAAIPVDITVATSSGTSATSPADQFTFLVTAPPTEPAPVITGITPNHGSDLGGDHVTITGNNFTGVTDVRFGGDFGEDAPTFAVVDDSHITATTPFGDPGTSDVLLYSSAGSSAVTAADQFTYDPKAAPKITKVSPSNGPDTGGTKVTITGTNLGGDSAMVNFGNTWAQDGICTRTKCVATAPPGHDGVTRISVLSNDGESQAVPADRFTYTAGPKPVITDVSPDSGTVDGGTNVAVVGSHLDAGTVTIGGAFADGTCGPTSCIVTTPPGSIGAAAVKVKTFAGSSAAAGFSYARLAKPVVSRIEPDKGWLAGFTEVDIHGADLTNGRVFFAGREAVETTCTQTLCTARSPDATTVGPVHITVRTPQGKSQTSSDDEFTYIEPTITSVTPNTGFTAGGLPVTIKGTNLGDATVEFGTRFADGTCTDTECDVTAPAQSSPGTVDIQVQSPFITKSPLTAADKFTYTVRPAPTVTGVSPNSGTTLGGDQVTVTGTNLSGGTVRFGTFAASTTCTSDTSCTVLSRSQASAGQVDVTVTTPAGTSAITSADKYTFTASALPAVTGLSPDHGSQAGGTPVTISGTNLTNGSVRFGTTLATAVTCLATSCTATSPPGSGQVDVRVQVGSQSAITPADVFSYEAPPPPTISKVKPAGGPSTGGTRVTITGTDLYGAAVQVGGASATQVICTATTCAFNAPPGTAGTSDVTATTPGGTSPVSTHSHYAYSRIAISENAIPGVTTATGGGAIVPGIGGDLWFTMPNNDKIGRIASDGTVTTMPTVPASATMPVGITKGPDGRMWYTEEKTNEIVAVDSGGAQTEYHVPGIPGDIRFITPGPDGRLWFTLAESGAIGAITTAGAVTLYHLPDPTVVPYNIVTGQDGRLWFTEEAGDAIGAISTDGTVHEYPLPDAGAASWGLSTGPDGRLWLAEEATGTIAAVTTAGQVTDYPLPAPDYDPEGLTYGADGRMWFTDPNVDEVSALDPTTGKVVDYALPGGQLSDQPRYLHMTADGSLWVTEFGGAKVLHVAGITAPQPPAVSDVSPDHGPTAGGTSVTITGANLGGAPRSASARRRPRSPSSIRGTSWRPRRPARAGWCTCE